MWRTPEGNRVLRGAEWELFREGLSCLWDLVEDGGDEDDRFGVGIDAFDSLQQGQKLARFTVRFFDWLLPAGHSNCQRLAHTLLDGERM